MWTGLLTVACWASGNDAAQTASAAIIGHWQGLGEVVGAWPRARTLTVDLTITADDSVHGTIGDAVLVQGRLVVDRTSLLMPARWKSEFVAIAMLSGPVVRTENIWRTSVQLMLTPHGDVLEGGLSTTGLRVLSSERRTVGARLTMCRAPE